MFPSRPMRPHSASHACLVRRFSLLVRRLFRFDLATDGNGKEERKDAHTAPERMHSVERLALAVLHRARCDVLDCRLVGTDEHYVRHEHR